MGVTTPDCQQLDAAAARRRPAAREADRFCVIDPPTWGAMLGHARSTPGVEVGGILLGEVCRDERDVPYLFVDGHGPALAAESASSSVTFTAEAWASIHAHIDRERPGAAIVGWYHTHPNFGIFLSEMDLFIQRHFFDAPHHVAVVIDPVRDESGAFVWREGECFREAVQVDGGAVGTTPAAVADTIGAKHVAIAASVATAVVAAALLLGRR